MAGVIAGHLCSTMATACLKKMALPMTDKMKGTFSSTFKYCLIGTEYVCVSSENGNFSTAGSITTLDKKEQSNVGISARGNYLKRKSSLITFSQQSFLACEAASFQDCISQITNAWDRRCICSKVILTVWKNK